MQIVVMTRQGGGAGNVAKTETEQQRYRHAGQQVDVTRVGRTLVHGKAHGAITMVTMSCRYVRPDNKKRKQENRTQYQCKGSHIAISVRNVCP